MINDAIKTIIINTENENGVILLMIYVTTNL